MLGTLIQKEIALHLLSVRFFSLLLMCVLLIPLNFHVNYRHYLQRQVDYQEAIKNVDVEMLAGPPGEWRTLNPNLEVSRVIFKSTPLSVFAMGLESSLPIYLGMTRNGIKQGAAALSSSPIASLFGQIDFVFIVGTVFSLLALLFTFDTVVGERESGTLRITLSNALPRDIFLWSKFIGGYLVFIVPFLFSFSLGLLVLVGQGFPLSEPGIFPRVLCLMFVSILYIAIFFALGAMISIYFDSSKTALIVAFTLWVFAVLILPRFGFLAAQILAPTRTAESVYSEKAAKRADFRADLEAERNKIISKMIQEGSGGMSGAFAQNSDFERRINEKMVPLQEAARLKYRTLATQLERRFQRETKRQEEIGMNLSRITPISAFTYIATGLTQTGIIKRDTYFQTGTRYYETLDAEMFSKMTESGFRETVKIPPLPPPHVLNELTFEDTFHHTVLDLLLLCLFAGGGLIAAFVKFFRTEI